MRSKLLFLKVLILAMAALSVTVQANYYTNPGFEDGSGDLPDIWSEWSGYGVGTYAYHIDDAVARTGDDCMEVGSPAGSSGDFQWLFIDIEGMSENTSYTLGGYFKDLGGSVGKVEIAFEWWKTRDEDKISYVTNQFTIPDDGGWHWVSWTQISPAGTLMISPMIGVDGNGESAYLLDDVVFRAAGTSNPQPGHNSKVPAPGTVDLKWENTTADTCTVYWDDGASDVNDINFQWHMDVPTGKITTIGTVLNDDPNEILGKVVAAGKNYCWRVDVGSQAGAVFNFSTVNDAPDVDAGPKQALWVADGGGSVTFQLAPTVNDDGLPVPPGTLKYLWTKTGGSGTVTFSPDATTKNATASMSVVDDYELTLTVSDGVTIPAVAPALDDSDTVKLRVHANDTTGLLGLYDMEEGNAAPVAHEDYTGRNHGDRYAGGVKQTSGYTGTKFVATGGHNDTDPCNLTGNPPPSLPDGNFGGLVFYNDIPGHIQFPDSGNDPNILPNTPGWADLRDEVTLAAWIKLDEDGWNNDSETIIAKGENSYRLQRNGIGDGVRMSVNIDGVVYSASGTTPINDIEPITATDPNIYPKWHHVVGTYDGAEVCVYVDGLEEECVAAEGQIDWPLYSGPDLTIGQSLENNSPFGGTMDEVRIHDIGLPHRSDNPEADPVHSVKARSVVSIYRASGGHDNCGGVYIDGDANEDCYVDLKDIKVMAGNWLKCNDIGEAYCIP